MDSGAGSPRGWRFGCRTSGQEHPKLVLTENGGLTPEGQKAS